MTFSENLLRLRKESGLTRTEPAKRVGISWRGYQNYERNLGEPQLHPLVAPADFYGISADELIGHAPRPRTGPSPRAGETENKEQ